MKESMDFMVIERKKFCGDDLVEYFFPQRFGVPFDS